MCKSATIQDGHLLDIDGNGIVSDDVIAEFERFEAAFWRIRDTPVRIYPVKEYGEVDNINIEIPKQRVNYDKRTGEHIIKSCPETACIYASDTLLTSPEKS